MPGPIAGETHGVLQVLPNRSGFLRRRENSYLPGGGDVFVSPRLVQSHGLRTGDEITGALGRPPGGGRSAPLVRVDAVNGHPPETARGRPDFGRLAAVHPDERLVLETRTSRVA
ncbi:MAG: transcription termination factor Rho, partial [Gemmatimonadetes bacterium]|nr:transcription termination factor Rho [Gemmatimonadota bacterium]